MGLMKGAVNLLRQLDEAHKNCSSLEDIFEDDISELRLNFRNHCERLLFTEPLENGIWAQQIIWKKAYYDVIQYIKQIKWMQDEANMLLEEHLFAGLGFYTLLLIRLQKDFTYPTEISFGSFEIKGMGGCLREAKKGRDSDSRKIAFVHQAIHHCIVCLGDLNRYMSELSEMDTFIVAKYYLRAIDLEPSLGMPYNQMANLVGMQNYGCTATYNYLRSLLCFHNFDSAEINLLRVFEKNDILGSRTDVVSIPPIQAFAMKFLKLCYQFHQQMEDDLKNYCELVMQQFDACLFSFNSSPDATTPVTNKEYFLFRRLIFEVSAISLMYVEYASKKNNPVMSLTLGLTVSIFSHLVHHCSYYFRDAIKRYEESPEFNKDKSRSSLTRFNKIRGRRRFIHRAKGDQDDSDLSESEQTGRSDLFSNADSDSDSDTITSDSQDEEDVPQSAKSNNENNSGQDETAQEKKLNCLTLEQFKKVILNNCFMSPIKFLMDWLRVGKVLDVPELRPLWAYLVNFLNILLKIERILLSPENTTSPQLAKYAQSIKSPKIWIQPHPLIEDYELRCLPVFFRNHSDLRFEENVELSPEEEMFLRIQCLKNFGLFLSNTGKAKISFDSEKATFYLSEEVISKEESGPEKTELEKEAEDKNKKKVMQSMCKLWLKAEVNDLEMKAKLTSRGDQISLFLVIDTSALINHLAQLKSLADFKRFILIIPTIVISSLDHMKKQSQGAREAIRWLEAELRRGNRFIRSQRHQEKMSLDPVKYPKKKDKVSCEYFKILECCKYLNDKRVNYVTLITSNKSSISTSISTIAISLGINIDEPEMYMKKVNTAKAKMPTHHQ